MSDFKTNIQKFGSETQLRALETLGKSNFNAKLDKLGTSYDASIFQGGINNFKNSALGTVMSENEVKALFRLLDADGDNNISKDEISKLSSLGGNDGKIDNKDIKLLFKNAKAYANETDHTKNTDSKANKQVSVDEKTGVKTVKTKSEDGTVKVVKYDKDGKKISSTTKDASGQVSKTKFTYGKDGKIASSNTTVTRKDENGNTYTVKTKETEYKNGQKSKMTEKDADGNLLSTSKYTYANNGKLQQVIKKNADNSVVTSKYNTTTGKIASKTTLNPDGRLSSRVDYNADGTKSSKTAYTYDEAGNRTSTRDYTYYADGQLKDRTYYDANGKITMNSTYVHNDDGSMTRTDRDPNSGKVIGFKNFAYNNYGQTDFISTLDVNGTETSRLVNNYNSAGKVTSKDNYIYTEDKENHTRTTSVDENNDGTIDSVSYFKEDENGNTISTSFDHNNDGKIDEVLHFEYDQNGKMIGRYTDENNDGIFDTYDTFDQNEKLVSSQKIQKQYV